jgi:hypothetical protein
MNTKSDLAKLSYQSIISAKASAAAVAWKHIQSQPESQIDAIFMCTHASFEADKKTKKNSVNPLRWRKFCTDGELSFISQQILSKVVPYHFQFDKTSYCIMND